MTGCKNTTPSTDDIENETSEIEEEVKVELEVAIKSTPPVIEGATANVKLDLENDSKLMEYAEYELKLDDERWIIVSQSSLLSWDEFLKQEIETLNFDLLYSNAVKECVYESWERTTDFPLNSEIAYERERVYTVDINNDSLEELLIHRVEGSMRNEYTDVYELSNDKYVLIQSIEGNIIPILYNGKVHYINVFNDFETKFLKGINEYTVENQTLSLEKTYFIEYNYETNRLPDYVTIDLLNRLISYDVSDTVARLLSDNYDEFIEIIDAKTENAMSFDVELDYTSVAYHPNRWKIKSADDWTLTIEGIEAFSTEHPDSNSEEVCIAFDVLYEEENVMLLKISYPFYSSSITRNGDLTLKLFKLNGRSLEKIDEVIVSPIIGVSVETYKHLEEKMMKNS